MENNPDSELLITDQQNEIIADQNESDFKNSVLVKTVTFGANGLFFAAHLVLNGKYLALLSKDGASASALMSTYQSVVLGSGVGFLLGTGLDFGTAVGQREYEKAGDVAKSATILSIFFGGLSAGGMLSTKIIFPLIFEKITAEIASDFFTGYAAASVPLLFLIVGPQIAFQEGDWQIPPICMLSVLIICGAASYLLGFQANLGALGIGLGGTVGSCLTAVGIGAWSLKGNYSKYRFYNFHINEFGQKIQSLLSCGWKLALQRLTEWGNLLAITTIVGSYSNSELKALNPGMLYLILFGTAQQGFAQAVGMAISKNKGELQKIIQYGDIDKIEENHKNNIKVIFHGNLLGLFINSIIASSFYLGREPLTNFFLSDDSNKEVIELAENLLWLNMLGLIPDALRIIGGGVLRGWKDLLYPTIISFVFMTVIGIPAAYGLGNLFTDETKMMIYMRDLTMLLSSIFILKRCHSNIKNDEATVLNEYINPPSFFRTGLSFFRRDNNRVQENNIDELNRDQVVNTLPKI